MVSRRTTESVMVNTVGDFRQFHKYDSSSHCGIALCYLAF